MTIDSHSNRFRFSKRIVLINSVSSIVTRLVNATVLLWVFQYLIKRIPAEEFAVYPVVSAAMVAAPLFFLLFSGGISRYMVEAHVQGKHEDVTRIVSTILPLIVLAALCFLGIGLSFAFNAGRVLNIPEEMNGEARLMLSLLVTSYAVRMIFVPFEAGFHVRQRFLELNLFTIMQELLKISLLLFLLFGFGPRVLWVVVATVVAELTVTLAMALRATFLLPSLRVRLSMFDASRAKILMSFGVWTMLGHLSAMMQTDAAVIILNLYATGVDVTKFYVGSSLYVQLNRTMWQAMSPLQPVLTALHSLDDQKRLANASMRGGRYACWMGFAVAVPLAIYAREFTILYVGEEYLSAKWVIQLLMVLLIFVRPTAFMGMVANAKARVREYHLATFLTLLVAVVGMIWMARSGYGAVGVALALTGIIFLSYVLFFWRFFLKLIGVNAGEFVRQVVVPGSLPAVVGGGIWLALREMVVIDSWGMLFLCSIVGGVVYLGVLFGTCLTPDDKADLRKVVDRFGPQPH